MCRSIAEGGTRCPIHRRDVMAAVSLASRASGLSTPLVQQIFHQLRKQARHQPPLEASMLASYQEELAAHADSSETALLQESARKDNPISPALAFATGTLREHALKHAETLNSIFEDQAASHGLNPEAMRVEFENAYARLTPEERNPTLQRETPPSPGSEALPPAFISALQKVARSVERQGRVVSHFESFRNSQVLESAGYDEESGRLEVKLKVAETLLAYRNVPAEVYRSLMTSSSPDVFFTNHIHSTLAYKYADASAADASAYLVRCGSCGQFRAAVHACPKREEQLEAEVNALFRDEAVTPAPSAHAQSVGEELEKIEPDPSTVENVAEDMALTPQMLDAIAISVRRSTLASMIIEGRGPREETAAEIDARLREPMLNVKKNATISFAHPRMRVMKGEAAYSLANEAGRHSLESAADRFGGDLNRLTIAAQMSEEGAIDTLYVLKPGERVFRVKEGTGNRYYVCRANDRVQIPDEPYEDSYVATIAKVRARADQGTSLEASSSKRNRSQSFFMGGRGDIVQGQAPKPADVRELAAQGKEVLVPVTLTLKVPSVDANGVIYHYDGGPRTGTVQGYIGFIMQEDGLASVTTSQRALKCSCATYREKYYCEHVAYVKNNERGFVQRMLPAVKGSNRLRAKATPPPEVPPVITPLGSVPGILARRLGLKYEESATGGYHTIAPRSAYEDITWHEASGYDMSKFVELRQSAAAAISSNKGVEEIREFGRAVVLSETGPIERASSLRAALRCGPVKMTLKTVASASLSNQVEGHVIVDKKEDGTFLIKERHLKCYCNEYEAKYDCPHVRTVTDDAVKYWLKPRNSVSSSLVLDADGRNAMRTVEAVFMAGDLQSDDVHTAYQAYESSRGEIADILNARAQAEEERVIALHNETRKRVQERWAERTDAGYSAEDISSFKADYERALRAKKSGKKPLEYKTSGVLDGLSDLEDPTTRKFGVELEFEIEEGRDRITALEDIARDLHESGLTSSPYQLNYGQALARGWERWTFEADGSVDGEVVSPILSDDEQSWKELQQVVHIIKKHGGRATVNVGSHVHVSSQSYGESLAKHAELVRTTMQHADTLYRLASNPSRGSHRGSAYCHPNIRPLARGDIPLGAEKHERDYYDLTAPKRELTVNLGASGDLTAGHVEYRLWDGTLDEAVIQQQVKMSVALTELAEQKVLLEGKSPARSTRHAIGEGLAAERKLKDKNQADTDDLFKERYAHVAEFIGSLFRKNEDRKDVTALFAITKWQEKSLYDTI